MNYAELTEYLEHTGTFRCAWGDEVIDTSFDTMPSEFIGFAEIDLQSEFEHKYINALSNAKRALDCQADRLLKLFGFYKESQDKFWGFPKKIGLIQEFDLIAPRVLNKINKTRNLMEHQYIKPKPDQVEDFIDIGALFIASTDHYVTHFRKNVEYINETDAKYANYGEISFDYDSELFSLKVSIREFGTDNDHELVLEKGNDNYIDLFKRHLKKIEVH
ncbi:hypothetical protein ACTJKC_21650 [Pedobacter sp. 22226]|uniref:hypothetical protein n=1 Tax=Pedobacter sp. 22226 TaxID=3453894 RepID=UPI003F84C26E